MKFRIADTNCERAHSATCASSLANRPVSWFRNPRSSFSSGTRNGSVIVVDADKTTHRREIEAGEVQDGKVQILKGLKGGESVASEGGYGLPDNIQVMLSPSDKDKPDGGDKTSKGEK